MSNSEMTKKEAISALVHLATRGPVSRRAVEKAYERRMTEVSAELEAQTLTRKGYELAKEKLQQAKDVLLALSKARKTAEAPKGDARRATDPETDAERGKVPADLLAQAITEVRGVEATLSELESRTVEACYKVLATLYRISLRAEEDAAFKRAVLERGNANIRGDTTPEGAIVRSIVEAAEADIARSTMQSWINVLRAATISGDDGKPLDPAKLQEWLETPMPDANAGGKERTGFRKAQLVLDMAGKVKKRGTGADQTDDLFNRIAEEGEADPVGEIGANDHKHLPKGESYWLALCRGTKVLKVATEDEKRVKALVRQLAASEGPDTKNESTKERRPATRINSSSRTAPQPEARA